LTIGLIQTLVQIQFSVSTALEKASLWDLPSIYAQFSLMGIEPVPFHPNIKPAGARPHFEFISLFLL
jgi:hypothetical protein